MMYDGFRFAIRAQSIKRKSNLNRSVVSLQIFKPKTLFDNGSINDFLAQMRQQPCDPIPPFSMPELKVALRKMKRKKCADESGIVAEMLQCAPDGLAYFILNRFNDILANGTLETSWSRTLFSMLPKAGGISVVGNWRPIAILKMT